MREKWIMVRGKTINPGMVLLVSAFLLSMPFSHSRAGWTENGKPVCESPGNQWYPTVISDGANGGLIVWQDYRGSNGTVFVQKIGEDGEPQWASGGITASSDLSEREFFRQAVPDGDGGLIVSWMDHRAGNIDIFVQKIDRDGIVAWLSSGVPVATSGDDEYYPAIVAFSGGGAFVAWQAGEDGSSSVIVQRVDDGGNVQWGSAGVCVSDVEGQRLPSMISDGADGVIVIWISGDAENSVIRAQRIDSAGNLLWTSSGLEVCSACDVHSFVCACADGSGGAILTWQDIRNGNHDIYMQRIDASGNIVWNTDGLAIGSGTGDQWLPQADSDRSGGVFVTWMNDSSGENDIYAQRIDDSGNSLWGEEGVAVCTAMSQQLNPQIIWAGDSEAIIVWQDGRGEDYDIYAQKIGGSGESRWLAGGVPIAALSGNQRLPELAGDGNGGAMIAWEDWNEESDIHCQRINASGEYVATSLASFSSSVLSDRIELFWSMNEIEPGSRFMISRERSGEGYFCAINEPCITCEHSGYRFVDRDVEPSVKYVYRVEASDPGGLTFLFETEALSVPHAVTMMYQNYPNPFNPVTTIEYFLQQQCVVHLCVYDVSGRRISELVDAVEENGRHRVLWNGCDDGGKRVSSGVYFYVLRAGKDVMTRKMILLR